ncbi:MAG: hypothetical protein V4498_07360 [candidate division FCPU426 bacterium]
MALNVDFRVIEKGFDTVAAAEASITGIENKGKFVTSLQGGIAWYSLNINGVVSSIPDLRATAQDLQDQINALISGGTTINFRTWTSGGGTGPDGTYNAGDLRLYNTGGGPIMYQSQSDGNDHTPDSGGDSDDWWKPIAEGVFMVGDLIEWLSKTKANAGP